MLIFQMNQHRDEMNVLLNDLENEKPECAKQFSYIKRTVTGVVEKDAELKRIISEHLNAGWSFDRISKVAASALKLAIYEMLYSDDVPSKAAINEAVDISKEYGDDKTGAFVNGVLSGVYKTYVDSGV